MISIFDEIRRKEGHEKRTVVIGLQKIRQIAQVHRDECFIIRDAYDSFVLLQIRRSPFTIE